MAGQTLFIGSRFHRVAVATGGCAVLGGIITLVGWATGIQRLTDWKMDGISMFPNAAVCAVMGGLALVLHNSVRRRWRLIPQLLSVFVALIGGATLFEHLTGINLGIDTLLFYQPWGQFAAAAPLRMGPPASTSFLLLGTGLLLAKVGRRARGVSAALGVTVAAIAALSLIGHFYGARPLYTLPRLTGIANQTAFMLLALAIGLVASIPERQPMRTLLARGAAGILARRALPIIILCPLALGWLRLFIQEKEVTDAAFATAMRTLVEIGLLTALLWWSAAMIWNHEQALLRTQTELRRQSSQLATVLETAAICIHRVGPDGTILWANQAELETFGYAKNEYIGHHIAEFHEDRNAIDDILERLQRGEKLFEQEARIKCKDGSIKTVLIDSCVLWDDGRFIHAQSFTRDITDRKHAQQELTRHRDHLDSLVKERTAQLEKAQAHLRRAERLAGTGTLVMGIAHEINNPLNSILLSAEYAATSTEPVDHAEYYEKIKTEANRAGRIVKNLLKFAREEETTKAPADLNMLVQHASQIIKGYTQSAGLELHMELKAERADVRINQTEIEQVLVNLIKNAAEAAKGPVRVAVETTNVDGKIILRVRDDGPGIPADILPHVFDPFFTTKRQYGGTGLGLSLCHSTIVDHGGTLTVDSEVDKGTTFSIELPIV